MQRRELSVLGVWRASWKIWTLAKIHAALTNQELALVVTWLWRSERRESETTMEDKISIAGHPELYDTSSYFYRNMNKKDLAWKKVSEHDIAVI